MSSSTGGMFIILIGLISILGAFLNWNIVVGAGKLIPRLLGPTGAKIFMIILGIVLIGVGMGIVLGLK